MWEIIAYAEPFNPERLPGAQINLDQILARGISGFLVLITVAAFFSLIYSGFSYITSAGDPAKTDKARKNIGWALLGLIIAMVSYFLVTAVANWRDFATIDSPNLARTTGIISESGLTSLIAPSVDRVAFWSEDNRPIADAGDRSLRVAQAPDSPNDRQGNPIFTDDGFIPGNLRDFSIFPPCLRTGDAAIAADMGCVVQAIQYYTAIMLVLVALGSFLYILYGAFLYTTAFGSEEKVSQAKKTITYALIGIVIATLAGVVVMMIRTFFRVS